MRLLIAHYEGFSSKTALIGPRTSAGAAGGQFWALREWPDPTEDGGALPSRRYERQWNGPQERGSVLDYEMPVPLRLAIEVTWASGLALQPERRSRFLASKPAKLVGQAGRLSYRVARAPTSAFGFKGLAPRTIVPGCGSIAKVSASSTPLSWRGWFAPGRWCNLR